MDEIWEVFDADNSGQLDLEETKKFVRSTLGANSQHQMKDEEVEQVFKEFDDDNSGLIDRHEMISFIKKLAGF